MKKKIFNHNKIVNHWTGIIEESTGLSTKNPLEANKIEWMSIYSHFHKVNESKNGGSVNALNEALYNTPLNTPGMGQIELPGNPAYAKDFSTQSKGSGDRPTTTLPIALQVAAQTIGLDLLPVVPMDGPLSFLTYVDFIYANGKLNQGVGGNGTDNRPEMVKFSLTGTAKSTFMAAWNAGTLIPGALLEIFNGSAAHSQKIVARFLTRSRLDGQPIVLIDKTVTSATPFVANSYAGAGAMTGDVLAFIESGSSLRISIGGVDIVAYNDATGVGAGLAGIASDASYVAALEDHISGYSGVYFQQILALAGTASQASIEAANSYTNLPYRRGDGEEAAVRSMGFRFFNKSVEAQTWKVDVAMTREQVQDSKHIGYDIISQANTMLANDTTQALNKHILERIFALGATNHEQIYQTTGVHFNINFDENGVGPLTFGLGYGQTGTIVNMIFPGGANDVPPARPSTLTGGETLLTAQRRLLDQFLAAGNMINIRGRRGPADCVVTNGHIATVLQTISGFQAAPMSNTFNQINGQLFPLGMIAGLTVYVDPNMSWDDTRFAVFRKGDGNTPGLIFSPYLLAESVEIISEGTMSHKVQLMSRYSLVEAGHHPHIYYITAKVYTKNGLLR